MTDEGAAVLAISIDSRPVAGRLSSSLGLTFPLLSDPAMEMADMGYVIIDQMGRIRYRQIDRRFGENVDPIIRVLRQLNREIGASSERAEKPSAM